ncbi:pole remodelling regulatory diguanylate cyclase [Vibrio ponticus]|nr:pole remodelling regulatory diguanylate cyclase [Vibrio ponticus]
MAKSAPLHDIGKVGVVDSILLKPGPLTEDEFEEMKKHTQYGYAAICAAEGSLGYADNFLIFAKEIAYSHHEKWDGSGYPQGLKGQDIPLSARIMAIADVYDALISERVYKPAFSHEKSVSIIEQSRGSHFEPLLVDVFLANAERFRQIAAAYQDNSSSQSNGLGNGINKQEASNANNMVTSE